jgi:hypothetical protein
MSSTAPTLNITAMASSPWNTISFNNTKEQYTPHQNVIELLTDFE